MSALYPRLRSYEWLYVFGARTIIDVVNVHVHLLYVIMVKFVSVYMYSNSSHRSIYISVDRRKF